MRLGRVMIHSGIIVDLDNERMVQDAQEAIVQDVMNMVKYGEEHAHVSFVEDSSLEVGEIPEHIWDDGDE